MKLQIEPEKYTLKFSQYFPRINQIIACTSSVISYIDPWHTISHLANLITRVPPGAPFSGMV